MAMTVVDLLDGLVTRAKAGEISAVSVTATTVAGGEEVWTSGVKGGMAEAGAAVVDDAVDAGGDTVVSADEARRLVDLQAGMAVATSERKARVARLQRRV